MLSFAGLVSAKSGKGFVQIEWDEKQGQLTPAEAMKLGLRAIQAGIEAERDAGLVEYLREEARLTDGQLAATLTGLRQHRDQWDPAEPF